MKARLLYPVKIAFALLSLFVMLQGCGLNRSVKEVAFIINGQKLEKPVSVVVDDGTLMVQASSDQIWKELGMSIVEYAPPASSSVYYSDQVAVLMYHQLVDQADKKKPHLLPVDQFEQQMKLLKERGFHVISMDEYVDFMTAGAAIPDNAVLLTFDDGYETFYTHAFPILQQFGYTATNFVIVASIDNQTGKPKLTWDQMREMKQAGMSFYSHTYNSHRQGPINATGKEKPMLSRHLYLKDRDRIENDEEYIGRITGDLATAEKRLREELGNTRRIVAFPYGAYNQDVLRVLNTLNIELSFTIKPGMTGREDRNAFRFNAGTTKQTPEELIKLLSEGGYTKKKKDNEVRVRINGKNANFTKKQPIREEEDILIPLRELCKMYSIEINWNNSQKTVALITTPVSEESPPDHGSDGVSSP
ncbi:polysaccharide deacetylase family protein [Paenibacillus thiaminolyticus]|uniref:Polysaccharide deacetylase n=1 Tax=Paenibacillus thiaminolyticus TaxID=49283 RepID=A0A3A3H3Z6_PANTH|nr:polysaccharide deacetylase family protein [Paenibacillus thiaminolyticus]RJG24026.1 polysaccharide deacetylase [Paenibacillus thiaminolyticus]